MTAPREQTLEKRYALVEQVVRANIAAGRLPHGLVLLEGPIAELLQTSRAPVQKALQSIEADGLIHRFAGRGYLVGAPNVGIRPLRTDIRQLGLAIPDEIDEALQSRSAGERIYLAVEQAVAACLIFGEYRIIETEIASHFNVSRTVVRDVLGRLQERGLVRKSQSSRWLAGPLTAQSIKERYEMRKVLEPAALLAAAAHVDREAVAELRDRAAAAERNEPVGGAAGWEEIENAFLEQCLMKAPNSQLVDAIRQNVLPLQAATRLLGQLGLPDDRVAITEIRIVLDLIANDAFRPAAEFLRDHLDFAAQRTIARLKIVAVIPEPSSLAPYLTAL
jgi:DNA-binding GntR family transcriptional regulator